ncbi:MAG: VOC family protein, partial [Pseudomonadota bacterium]
DDVAVGVVKEYLVPASHGLIAPVSRGHIAYRTDDLAAFKAHLEAHDVPYADWGNQAVAGWNQIFFYDPDGNVIEVHEVSDDT